MDFSAPGFCIYVLIASSPYTWPGWLFWDWLTLMQSRHVED
jgi:hypothetical protein